MALAVFLLFSPTILHTGAADDFQRITILISDDSVIASAERLHVSPKSIQNDVEPILISKAEQVLDGIRRAGINFRLVDILTYTVHAAIIEVPSSQEQSLKSIIEPQRIQGDYVMNIDVQERPVLGALGGELQALSRNSTGAGVLIAVVDTGVDYTHPDLGSGFGPGYKVVGGHDYVDNDNDPADVDGHGTHIAGIIAANGKFSGVAPDAKILAYRVVDGAIVIAAGGGGIPVIRKNGLLVGVEAVIDKDLTGSLLASALGAETFLILTDVEKAALNYGKDNQVDLDEITVSEAERYIKEGHFGKGSMEPKMLAALRFIKSGGKVAIISSLEKALPALLGKAGTRVVA